ncbi:hypothetical protein Taro_018131 [Colocasia esculenta]|uniref:Uncharacterized protein n=1 Tax=Colocasia esculenta TaxID=4460 RepID=A0A843UQL9_COLES|nr:hypothetical protein [Colocasia esculenta]
MGDFRPKFEILNEDVEHKLAWMAESGRMAGSAPADPDPESGRVGLSRDSGLCKPVLWVGRCSPPPESGRQGPTRLRVGRLRSESADFAIHLDNSKPQMKELKGKAVVGKCLAPAEACLISRTDKLTTGISNMLDVHLKRRKRTLSVRIPLVDENAQNLRREMV